MNSIKSKIRNTTMVIGVSLCMFCLTACSSNQDKKQNEVITESLESASKQDDIEIESTEKQNDIEKKSNENKELILQKNSLDLNGNGVANDTLIVEQIADEEKYTLVTVKLESGLVASIEYPFMSSYKVFLNIQTGKLRYEEKDSIIIGLTDGTSNYGSTDIHVLHVESDENKVNIIEDLTILDNNKDSDRYKQYENTVFIVPGRLVTMTNENELFTYVNDINKNALKVNQLYEDLNEDVASYIFWDGEKWTVLEQ